MHASGLQCGEREKKKREILLKYYVLYGSTRYRCVAVICSDRYMYTSRDNIVYSENSGFPKADDGVKR